MTTDKAIITLRCLHLLAEEQEAKEAILMAIKALKQPEQKKGKWIEKPDPYGFFETIPVCSECGCTTKYREKYTCCPNCGAKMEVEE